MEGCEIPDSKRLENRGLLWMAGAFVFCPCHLPITLSVLALMLGGTAAGALLHAHPYIAALFVTLLWAAGTWRGLVLVRRARPLGGTSGSTPVEPPPERSSNVRLNARRTSV